MRSRGTDILLALSLANLNLLQVWRELLFASPADLYWMPTAAPHDYAAAVFVMVALAAVFFLVLRPIRRLPGRLADLAFLALIAVALINLADLLRRTLSEGWSMARVLRHLMLLDEPWKIAVFAGLFAFAALCLAILLSIRASRIVARTVYVVGVILSAFAVSNAVQALWHLGDGAQASVPGAGAPASGAATSADRVSGRVVWLIFDELDARDLFTQRKPDRDYPAFDELRRQSTYFTQVHPPGGSTVQAVPTLWLGRHVAQAEPKGPSQLAVRLDGETEFRDLRALPHLFAEAKARGAEIAAIGWYHPYCRLFPAELSRCQEFFVYTTRPTRTEGFTDALGRTLNSLHVLWRWVIQIETYERMRAGSLDAATDPRFDLVAVHVSVPHRPYVFDPKRGELTWFGAGLQYEDNLALADRYLGELRDAMIKSGLWDDTAIIATADHGRRDKGDGAHRDKAGIIPLFVKLPGQRQGAVIAREVHAEIQRDLILDLLTGTAPSVDQLASWLDRKGN